MFAGLNSEPGLMMEPGFAIMNLLILFSYRDNNCILWLAASSDSTNFRSVIFGVSSFCSKMDVIVGRNHSGVSDVASSIIDNG